MQWEVQLALLSTFRPESGESDGSSFPLVRCPLHQLDIISHNEELWGEFSISEQAIGLLSHSAMEPIVR